VQKKLTQRITRKLNRMALIGAKTAIHYLRPPFSKETGKSVIFVTGVQRSATNMMMGILERSFETDVLHEWYKRAYHAYEMRSYEHIHPLVSASKASVVVLKALCEMPDMRTMLDEFQPARSIWMFRDYNDVVNSHIKIWFDMPKIIGEIVQKQSNYSTWHGRGISEKTHEQIKDVFHPDISNASAVALFWYFRNAFFWDQGLDDDERVYLAKYENIVADPAGQLEKLFGFLGLPCNRRSIAIVRSNSVKKSEPSKVDPAIRGLCDSMTARLENAIS